jgi:hypothetical protein
LAFDIFLAALFQALLFAAIVESGFLSKDLRGRSRERLPCLTICQPEGWALQGAARPAPGWLGCAVSAGRPYHVSSLMAATELADPSWHIRNCSYHVDGSAIDGGADHAAAHGSSA